MHTYYKTSFSFQHTGLSHAMQFCNIESFSISLTNKIIDSDVIINQDSIDGYEG
jgi:hypothetical protein